MDAFQTIAGFYAEVMAVAFPRNGEAPSAPGSGLFWNTDDIEPNGRYRLPWIYSTLPAAKSGLFDKATRAPRPKTWRIAKRTLFQAIRDGRLEAFGEGRGRYIRGLDLIRFLQGRFSGSNR